VLITRPRRPHPDRRRLFSQNKQRCSFGQCAVFGK
ncbi:MAG: hypothetical protein ACI853_001116, partial [Paracoccaceae bacterium]